MALIALLVTFSAGSILLVVAWVLAMVKILNVGGIIHMEVASEILLAIAMELGVGLVLVLTCSRSEACCFCGVFCLSLACWGLYFAALDVFEAVHWIVFIVVVLIELLGAGLFWAKTDLDNDFWELEKSEAVDAATPDAVVVDVVAADETPDAVVVDAV
jgi:hypothetical protein